MSKHSMDRRKLLGILAASGSAFALPAGLGIKDLLQASGGEERVGRILRTYYKAAYISDQAVKDFYASLMTGKGHREDQVFFQDHLSKAELQEKLELYVVEEFAVSANYLLVVWGQASELKLRIS